MSEQALLRLLPVIIVSAGVLVLLIQASVRRHDLASFTISLVTLVAAMTLQMWQFSSTTFAITILFEDSPLSGFFSMLVYLSCLSVLLLHRRYHIQSPSTDDKNAHHLALDSSDTPEIFYLLLLLSGLGGLLLVMANHAVAILLGSELMGLAMLALLALNRARPQSIEATIKYLILSGVATSMMILGLAMLYAQSGDLSLAGLAQSTTTLITLTGMIFLLTSLAFKLSLVPVHFWTADVYQGAPSNAVLLLTTLSKSAVFALTIKFILLLPEQYAPLVTQILSVIAIASMLLGNWLALQQQNLKRLMAYSAIAHMGYALVAVIVAVEHDYPLIVEGAAYYVLAYLMASIIIFAVITQRSSLHALTDLAALSSYKGLYWQHPLQAVALSLAFLSLAGMPVTIGFIGKFYLLSLAVDSGAWALVVAMILGSGIGLYYYLRVIFTLFDTEQSQHASHQAGILSKMWVGILTIAVVVLGILPGLLGDYLPALLSSAG